MLAAIQARALALLGINKVREVVVEGVMVEISKTVVTVQAMALTMAVAVMIETMVIITIRVEMKDKGAIMATVTEGAVMEGMIVTAVMVAMIAVVEARTMAVTEAAAVVVAEEATPGVTEVMEEVIDPATIEMGGIEMEDMGKHNNFHFY